MKSLSYCTAAILLTVNFLVFAQDIVKTHVNQQRIYIQFDKSMNTSVDLIPAIQIFPSIYGNWKWVNDNELIFIADSSFTDNTIYIVTLSNMIDSECKPLSPYSFYFVNRRDEYNVFQVPFQWESVKKNWDIKVDWNKGVVYYTLKSRMRDINKAQSVIEMDFLWRQKFYGPLKSYKSKPEVIFKSNAVGDYLVVNKEGKEIWQRKLNRHRCTLACTNDFVSVVAAICQTGEGQRLYVFDFDGRTLWKYALFNCHLMNFSSSGAFLTTALISNDVFLFNVPKKRLLWRKKFLDSVNITALAVSNKAEVAVMFDNKSTDTIPTFNNSKLVIYQRNGEVVWQKEFHFDSKETIEIQFTDIGEYFLIYNDNKLSCYKITRDIE